jgi:hypothetical protein
MKIINYSDCFKISLVFLTLMFLNGCSKSKLDTDDEKIIDPNPVNRAKEFAAKGGGIFGDINNRKLGSTAVDFASSNVMWKATLKTLEFLPLSNTDYSGGIIVYDWYSQTNNPKEQIKISVQFLNNELRSDSVKITAHKKICETVERCSNSTLDQNFANSIKDSIIASARTLKIEEAKKEKK